MKESSLTGKSDGHIRENWHDSFSANDYLSSSILFPDFQTSILSVLLLFYSTTHLMKISKQYTVIVEKLVDPH